MMSTILRERKGRRWIVVMAGTVVLAHAPLMVGYAVRQWQLPHYQYAPLMYLLVAALAWRRCTRAACEGPPAPRLALALLLTSTAILAAGVFLYSPWLAAVSLNLALGGLAVAWVGRSAIRRLGPVWLLLWFAVPVRLGWDLQVIASLQTVTSRTSSQLLDLVDVPHLMAGSVLEFPGQRFLVEEACSGVQSLFALLAATAVYLVLRRRAWTVAAVLLPGALAAAVMMNVARVTTIAVAYQKLGLDLSTGWQHEALGLGTFALALLLLVATEQVALFFLRPIEPPRDLSVRKTRPSTRVARSVCHWWNRVFAGATRPAAGKGGAARVGNGPTSEDAVGGPARAFRGLVPLSLFGSLAAIQCVLLLSRDPAAIPIRQSMASLDADSLPQQHGEWSQRDFRRERRDPSSDQGQHTAAWEYQAKGYAVQFACDYPFVGWHELPRCYRGTGWTVVAREIVSGPVADGRRQLPYVWVELKKPSGEAGLLCFTLIDSDGQPVPIPESRGSFLLDLRYRLSQGIARYGWDVSTYQIQAFAQSPGRLPPEAAGQLREAYVSLRQSLMEELLCDDAS